MNGAAAILGYGAWVVGMVIAPPGWQTVIAVIIPPYSWYLFAELLVIKYGLT